MKISATISVLPFLRTKFLLYVRHETPSRVENIQFLWDLDSGTLFIYCDKNVLTPEIEMMSQKHPLVLDVTFS